MDAATSGMSIVLALLLLTTFVKTATVLSIARYGLGLVGFEFGAVCLVVALAMAWMACPPELTAFGLPEALFSRSQPAQQQPLQPQAISQALVPYMQRRIDPVIARHLLQGDEHSKLSAVNTGAAKGAERDAAGAAPAGQASALRVVVPAYLLSELKSAFQIGCLVLIPLVTVDLLVAHVLALVGVHNIAAAAVALPLKLVLFIVAGGWGLLGRKFLGLE